MSIVGSAEKTWSAAFNRNVRVQ